MCKALCSPSGLQRRQALLLHTKLFEGDNPKRASAILGHVDRDRFFVSMFESYMLNDQPSPVVKPLYLSTFLTRKSNALPRVFAIDCEMVKTTFGLELVRVTLIRLDQKKSNETATCHYTTVLDMLVKPPNKIIDFVTGE